MKYIKHVLASINNESVTNSNNADEADQIGNPVNTLFNSENDAFESLQWIDFINMLYANGDLALLGRLLPPIDKSIPEIIEEALSKCKDNKIIKGYQVYENKGREKLGLPKHNTLLNNIYLYQADKSQPYVFDENYTLRKQLQSILYTVPYVNAYYIPGPNVVNNQEISQQLLAEMIKCVAKKCYSRVHELFGDFFKSEGN